MHNSRLYIYIYIAKVEGQSATDIHLSPCFVTMAAAATALSSCGVWNYDVFVSFIEEDSTKNFTTELFRSLEDAGVIPFRRVKESPPEILKAIQESCVLVIVFSTHFADSKHHLEEVEQIVDCQKANRSMVIPIFFGIDESNVEEQTGSFQEAFSKYEKSSILEDKVFRWRIALREAIHTANKQDMKNYRTEGECIKEVVRLVLVIGIGFERIEIGSTFSFDVFVSFIWEDTWKNFTNELYSTLEDAGVNPFRRRKLVSFDISKPIQHSRISIIVFSRNYGASRWCLEELVSIMECRKATGRLVIPIFYDIDPSDVKNQTGSFEEAFTRYEEGLISMDKVLGWRTALKEAANLTTCQVKHGHEGNSIKEVVEQILNDIKTTSFGLVSSSHEVTTIISPTIAVNLIPEASVASPPPSPTLWKYDVFVSMRGEGNSNNFTIDLYCALEDAGMNRFRRENHTLSEIFNSIQESMISVIVFSSNYGASRLCLEELVYINECRKAIGHLVLPIFYDIDPSDVRKQKRSLEQVFAQHDENSLVENDTVLRWRIALQEVANLSGWPVKHGEDSGCIKKVVERIANHMKDPAVHEEKYDVFLSFRGEETRRNVVTPLYNALTNAGVNTFMDDIELRRGEDIATALFEAIQNSRVTVVVLSPDYANSSWCLEELVKVMECKVTSIGELIIPLLYQFNLFDERKLVKSFKEALSKSGKHTELLRLRAALKKLTDDPYSLRVNGDVPQDEGNLMRSVRQILDHLTVGYQVKVDFPVGIDSRFEDLAKELFIDSTHSCTRMIGICELGGMGKTRIVREVFNSSFNAFHYRSFLPNVRQASKKPDGLVGLQKQFLADVRLKKTKVANVYKGITKIRFWCKWTKVLIVLDDVDSLEQIKAIAGDRNWFSWGSVIIITTRDPQLLREIGVDCIYKVEELNGDESLELFSWHAFGKNRPPRNYFKISKLLAGYCTGMPGALVSLASFLSGKDIAEWETVLHQIQNMHDEEIGYDEGKSSDPFDKIMEAWNRKPYQENQDIQSDHDVSQEDEDNQSVDENQLNEDNDDDDDCSDKGIKQEDYHYDEISDEDDKNYPHNY